MIALLESLWCYLTHRWVEERHFRSNPQYRCVELHCRAQIRHDERVRLQIG